MGVQGGAEVHGQLETGLKIRSWPMLPSTPHSLQRIVLRDRHPDVSCSPASMINGRTQRRHRGGAAALAERPPLLTHNSCFKPRGASRSCRRLKWQPAECCTALLENPRRRRPTPPGRCAPPPHPYHARQTTELSHPETTTYEQIPTAWPPLCPSSNPPSLDLYGHRH